MSVHLMHALLSTNPMLMHCYPLPGTRHLCCPAVRLPYGKVVWLIIQWASPCPVPLTHSNTHASFDKRKIGRSCTSFVGRLTPRGCRLPLCQGTAPPFLSVQRALLGNARSHFIDVCISFVHLLEAGALVDPPGICRRHAAPVCLPLSCSGNPGPLCNCFLL